MSYKKLILGAAVCFFVASMYYLYNNFQVIEEDSPNPQRLIISNSDLESHQKLTAVQNRLSHQRQPEIVVAEEEPNESETLDVSASYGFLTSEVFSSPDNIDNAFIQSDGTIVRDSLTHLFQHENFDEVVTRIREAGYNELSLSREALLSRHLNDTLGSGVFKRDYSCSGSICVLTFQSVNDVSEQEFTELAKFDKNYSFTNAVTNDLGETTVNAVYIATENPSTLSLTH